MTSMVSATFKTRMEAESALRGLEGLGVTQDQISMVLTDETRGKTFNIETHNKLDAGLATGATAGGVIGALLGSLGAATAVAIPGLNVVVVGTLISAIAGFGAGAATGGLLGAMVGAGIPEHEAKIYENEIKDGAVLVSVQPADGEQKDRIEELFKNKNATKIAA